MTFEILPSRTCLGWLKVPQHKSHSCFETMVITVKTSTAEAGSSPKSCCIWGGWGEPGNKHQALYQAALAHWKNHQASRSGNTQYTVTPDFLFFYCSSLYFNILIVKNDFFPLFLSSWTTFLRLFSQELSCLLGCDIGNLICWQCGNFPEKASDYFGSFKHS